MSTPWPTPPRIPDYDLLKPIGRGSYGEVWLARSVTGVFRIIKVVRRDRFEDDRPYRRELEGISRFQAAASGRPRQLALLHVGRNDEAGYFYYVMEPADDVETGSAIDPERYIPLTLRELFARRGRLPAAECVQLALELARGLAVLHNENLIHRDIKPSNIIFVQRVPKLADVGLVASSDTAMTCVGTPGYSPPEGPGTPAADLYGLGKVLYEIATGLDRLEFPRLPSDIADSSDTPLLREINALVLRTCDPDPRNRPASAEIFARDLELIQAGQSVAFYESVRRRLRLFAISAGIVALLAAFGAGLFFWRAGILTAANDDTRRALYRSDLAVAQLALAGGDFGRARAALERQIPRPGQSDLRGFEWYILANAVRGDGVPLEPATNGVAVRKITADPSGRWIAASFENNTAAIWDLETRKIVRRLNDVQVLGGFTTNSLLVVDEPARALRYESPTGGVVKRVETGKRLLQLLDDNHLLLVTPTDNFRIQTFDTTRNLVTWEYDITENWPHTSVSAIDYCKHSKSLTLGLFREVGIIRSRVLATIFQNQPSKTWSKQINNRTVWLRHTPSGEIICANIGGLSPLIIKCQTGAEVTKLDGHGARIQDAAFSPNGDAIATGSADQTIRVWDPRTGKFLESLKGHARPVTAVAWLTSGTEIIAGSDFGEIQVFGLNKSRPNHLASGFYSDINGDLVLRPDSRQIAVSTSTNSITLLDPKDLSNSTTISNAFQPITYTPDGQSLIALQHNLLPTRINLTTHHQENLLNKGPTNLSLLSWALSRDSSKYAMSGKKGDIFVVDLESGTSSYSPIVDSNRIWALAFTPDSQELWIGTASGKIQRLNSTNLTKLGDITQTQGEVQTLAISPDRRWIAAGIYNDSSIQIFDTVNGVWHRMLVTHRRFVTCLSFTTDGQRLVSAAADGRMVIWRVPEFEELAALSLEPSQTRSGDEGIAAFRIAHDQSSVAALTEDGRVQVWVTAPTASPER